VLGLKGDDDAEAAGEHCLGHPAASVVGFPAPSLGREQRVQLSHESERIEPLDQEAAVLGRKGNDSLIQGQTPNCFSGNTSKSLTNHGMRGDLGPKRRIALNAQVRHGAVTT